MWLALCWNDTTISFLPHMRSNGGACEVILGTQGLTHTDCARELVGLTVDGLKPNFLGAQFQNS